VTLSRGVTKVSPNAIWGTGNLKYTKKVSCTIWMTPQERVRKVDLNPVRKSTTWDRRSRCHSITTSWTPSETVDTLCATSTNPQQDKPGLYFKDHFFIWRQFKVSYTVLQLEIIVSNKDTYNFSEASWVDPEPTSI